MDDYKEQVNNLKSNFLSLEKDLTINTNNYYKYPKSTTYIQKYKSSNENFNNIMNDTDILLSEILHLNEYLVNDLDNINNNLNLTKKKFKKNNTEFKNQKNINSGSLQLIDDYKSNYNFQLCILIFKFISIILILMFIKRVMPNKDNKQKINEKENVEENPTEGVKPNIKDKKIVEK